MFRAAASSGSSICARRNCSISGSRSKGADDEGYMRGYARRRPSAGERVRSTRPADATAPSPRLIARGRHDEVLAIGLPRPSFHDLYHFALRISWSRFLGIGIALFAAANALFALVYLIPGDAITNARPGSFADAFFFSVQTMATIGYGVMAPATFYANLLMTFETAVGLMFVALTTGLVFARFSRPTARVLFSKVAVVSPYNGVPTLSIRVANQRQNQLLAAEVSMTLVRDETSEEGELTRRFYDLALVRDRSPVFALTFRVMRPIDANSPLHGLNYETLAEQHAEIVVIAGGIDETLVQRVGARTSYLPHEILWAHR